MVLEEIVCVCVQTMTKVIWSTSLDFSSSGGLIVQRINMIRRPWLWHTFANRFRINPVVEKDMAQMLSADGIDLKMKVLDGTKVFKQHLSIVSGHPIWKVSKQPK